jgi:Cu-processing system ATP-binding protein
MVLGLSRPDSGQILVGGTAVNGSGAYRTRIGYMPQVPCFPDNLSVGEIIALVASLRARHGSCPAPDNDLIGRFGLTSVLNRPVRALSAGTQHKLSAVLALRFQPQLLVLDEPTAALDPVAARTLKDLIRDANAGGTTVLIASHVMAELEELADDVVFLLDGRTRFTGPTSELIRGARAGNLEDAIVRTLTERRTPGAAA